MRPLDVWAFLVPATSFAQLTIGGRLILSEVLALVLLPWLLRANDRLRAPRWLFLLLGLWFASQAITDFVVGSAFSDWVRGWAAIAFTLVDLLAILALAGTARRARIFAAGIAAGLVLEAMLNPTPFILADPWKFAIAAAIGYVMASVLAGDRASRRPWLAIGFFVAFGILNSFSGFRSMSGVALLTAVFVGLDVLLAGVGWLKKPHTVRLAGGLALYGASALLVYAGLSAATSAGVFGASAQAKFEDQAGISDGSPQPGASGPIQPGGSGEVVTASPTASSPTTPSTIPVGVLLGGRSELLPSTQAIIDSPIIGHGSWARGPKYVELQRQRLIEMGVPRGNVSTDPTLIPTHSYLLGSWVWAGVLGGMFWIGVAAFAIWTLVSVLGTRLAVSPLLGFVASLLLWSIAFSPYSNTERMYAMFAVVVCILAHQLVRRRQEKSSSPESAAT